MPHRARASARDRAWIPDPGRMRAHDPDRTADARDRERIQVGGSRWSEAGEAVVVTDRGRPVARLGPLEGAAALEGRVEKLARAGLVRRPVSELDANALARERPADPEGRSLEAILEERAEGW